MFEHLLPDTPKKTRHSHRSRMHGSIITLLLAIYFSLGIVVVFKVWFASIPQSIAIESDIRVHIIDPDMDTFIVSPLTLYPLSTLSVTVEKRMAQISELRFSLEGIYDPGDIEGLYLYIDEVQIGQPELPNEFGVVDFFTNGFKLEPGRHTFRIAISSDVLRSGTMFKTVFDTESSFSFISLKRNIGYVFVQPYSSALLKVVDRGIIHTFLKGNYAQPEREDSKNVYITISGEDARLHGIHFSSLVPLTGSRLDIFMNERFMTAAVFDGIDAYATFESAPITLVRDRNTTFTIHFVGDMLDNDQTRIDITGIDITGLHSGSSWQEDPALQIL